MILNKIRSQYIYIFIYFNKINEKYIKKHKDKKKKDNMPGLLCQTHLKTFRHIGLLGLSNFSSLKWVNNISLTIV